MARSPARPSVPEPPRPLSTTIRERLAAFSERTYPTIAVAARTAGLSVRSFQRRLEDEGVNYSQLIDRVRLDRATQLLDAPGARVIDVALEVGYSDPAHFTRAFRRWTGVTPRQFRGRRASIPACRT